MGPGVRRGGGGQIVEISAGEGFGPGEGGAGSGGESGKANRWMREGRRALRVRPPPGGGGWGRSAAKARRSGDRVELRPAADCLGEDSLSDSGIEWPGECECGALSTGNRFHPVHSG